MDEFLPFQDCWWVLVWATEKPDLGLALKDMFQSLKAARALLAFDAFASYLPWYIIPAKSLVKVQLTYRWRQKSYHRSWSS